MCAGCNTSLAQSGDAFLAAGLLVAGVSAKAYKAVKRRLGRDDDAAPVGEREEAAAPVPEPVPA